MSAPKICECCYTKHLPGSANCPLHTQPLPKPQRLSSGEGWGHWCVLAVCIVVIILYAIGVVR